MVSQQRPEVSALRDEVAGLMRDLGTALGAEFGALRARDIDALEAVVAQKMAIINALEAATVKVGRLDQAIRAEEFNELGSVARDCLVANRINGGAIELNRNLVDRLLDTVRGTPRALPVYDAQGRLNRHQSGRQMGRA